MVNEGVQYIINRCERLFYCEHLWILYPYFTALHVEEEKIKLVSGTCVANEQFQSINYSIKRVPLCNYETIAQNKIDSGYVYYNLKNTLKVLLHEKNDFHGEY